MRIYRRRVVAVTLFAGLLGALGIAQVQTLQPPLPRGAQPQVDAGPEWKGKLPLVSLSGSFSQVRKHEILRVTDQKIWDAVWQRHMGDHIEKNSTGREVIPQVDFDTCMVLAIFRGESSNCDGEYIVGIEERADSVLVRYDSYSYQSASGFGNEKPVEPEKLTPYGLFVIPRTVKPLVVEENVQSLLDHAPIWKERIRYPRI